MRIRLLCLFALLTVLGGVAPTVASGAVAKNVKRVLNDYKNDGKIEPCRHSAKDLRDTLKAIEANTEQYAPDFPAAVEAALEARASGDCRKPEATPTPTPTATATPSSSSSSPPPASPAAPAAPSSPPDSAPEAPAVQDPAPAPTAAPTEEVVPVPPAPDGAGITPGTPPPTPNDSNVILKRTAGNDGSELGPAPWIALGGLLGAALLAGLILLFLKRFGWGEERLAPLTHAVGEAGYRTGGGWQAFTDWVRRGR